MSKMTNNKIEEMSLWYEHKASFYELLSIEVSSCIEKILSNRSVDFHRVEKRGKDIKSFVNKISSPNYEGDPKKMGDLAAVRVIVYIQSDVEKVADLIRENFNIVDESNKSEMLGVDKFGYRDLHFNAKFSDERISLPEYTPYKDVVFEIQVRTILEHAWAEIEHDRRYKVEGLLDQSENRRINRISSLLELADEEFDRFASNVDQLLDNRKKKHTKELIIPRGTKKLVLKKIGDLLKGNPGSDRVVVIIPGDEVKRLDLPYTVNLNESLREKIDQILKKEIPF